jgi:hypothetical protein
VGRQQRLLNDVRGVELGPQPRIEAHAGEQQPVGAEAL